MIILYLYARIVITVYRMDNYVIVRPHKEVTKPFEGPEGSSWLKPDKLVTEAEPRSLIVWLKPTIYLPEGPSNGLVTDLRGLSVLENEA